MCCWSETTPGCALSTSTTRNICRRSMRRGNNRMAVLREARRQLGEYFAGSRERFDVPLAPEGTPFQRAIWNAIAEVPCGATRTYADLAVRTGRPGCARAAGAATGRNPLSI